MEIFYASLITIAFLTIIIGGPSLIIWGFVKLNKTDKEYRRVQEEIMRTRYELAWTKNQARRELSKIRQNHSLISRPQAPKYRK